MTASKGPSFGNIEGICGLKQFKVVLVSQYLLELDSVAPAPIADEKCFERRLRNSSVCKNRICRSIESEMTRKDRLALFFRSILLRSTRRRGDSTVEIPMRNSCFRKFRSFRWKKKKKYKFRKSTAFRSVSRDLRNCVK